MLFHIFIARFLTLKNGFTFHEEKTEHLTSIYPPKLAETL